MLLYLLCKFSLKFREHKKHEFKNLSSCSASSSAASLATLLTVEAKEEACSTQRGLPED